MCTKKRAHLGISVNHRIFMVVIIVVNTCKLYVQTLTHCLLQNGCLYRLISRSESRGEGESSGSHGGTWHLIRVFLGFP